MAQAVIVQSYDPRDWARAWEDARTALRAEAPRNGVAGIVPSKPMLAAAIAALVFLVAGLAYAFAGSDSTPTGRDLAVTTTAELSNALDEAPPQLSRSFRLGDIAELEATLTASGFDAALVADLVASARSYFTAGEEVRGTLTFAAGEGGALQLATLDLRKRDSSGVVFTIEDGAPVAQPVSAQLTQQVFVASGRIDESSIYTSVLAAGFPNALIDAFFEALAFDFDFAREINSNDAFEIAYRQTVNEEGEPMGAPVLLYASMTTPTRTANVYRFEGADGEVAWYDASGQNTRRSLMRTPVDGARLSSRFGMRHHPIYNRSRLHGGVDFAAPTGTPVFASGNGTIEIARAAPHARSGNGSYIAIQHDNGWRTLYLHLNAFAPGIEPGVRVRQGQVIGEVGSTGGSTGPHLHYEVHIDGQKMDPLTVQGSDERQTLTGDSLQAFENVRDEINLGRETGVRRAN
ncbi:M23 family metallopeptidase [Erythrobacter sp. EC-HK427]|uniref:M23 family metallopeptidase n=1 Tax=Erythrobacter sp. EC-HK427 TaxID=2038396 RepID=UPI001256D0CE|nr:M23 family metallopeptidase [Erythrobacter sp. EC-HK427]VVT17885.1 conserved hypothetical protein [Erythrobacter sp. EC-HK427]